MGVRWLTLAVLATAAFAGPINYKLEAVSEEEGNQCARTCKASEKFGYEEGKTYEFHYTSDVMSTVAGATDKDSRLHLTTTAKIEVLAPCEMSLYLTDLSLKDSDPSNKDRRQHVLREIEFKRQLTAKPLRFSFQDGEVESICHSGREEPWVLNIKRGVLSAFQNTMPQLRENAKVLETDVAGTCHVEYKMVEDGNERIKISKIKDLLGCIDRHAYTSAFQANPYAVNSKIQSMPVLKGTHECEQEIHTDGRLLRTHCVERHVFRPFSKHHSGALTESKHTLTYRRTIDGTKTKQDPISDRAKLLFDHTLTREEEAENKEEVADTMRNLCEASKTDIRPEVPGLFMKMVQSLRKLDGSQMMGVYRDINGNKYCENAQKFFRDGLSVVGSTGSVMLIKELIVKGELTEEKTDMWLTSLAFIQEPREEMLKIVKPLIQSPTPRRKAMLAVSTLLHGYCRQNPNCGSNKEVKNILNIFKKNLGFNCAGKGNDREKVLMSLKAIGNTGEVSSALDTIFRCIKNTRLDTEVRIAAAAAMRRLTCSDEMDELLDMVTDPEWDTEIRIATYLALIRCPTSGRISRIRDMLKTEPINQVSSFIWTHLTNLMETSNPFKQQISEIVHDVQLNSSYSLDKRKFSRNIEWSLFSDMLNLGGSFESNLIWSTQSFVPRSAMVNLKFDLFGHEIDLVEAGVRTEGLQDILENLFGPNRAFDNTVQRGKRAAKKGLLLNQIKNKFDLPALIGNKGSMYLKIFGNEIRYDDFSNLDMDTLKEKFNYLTFLIELAKEHKFDITKNMFFLDTTMKVPTLNGMPLKMHVKGAASVDLKVKGKFDVRKIWNSPRSVDIGGSIEPSGAIEITGDMGVDAVVARTGLTMTSTLHTSTMVEGSIKLKEGKDLAVEFNMPKQKLEIVDVSTKFYLLHRDNSLEQQMITTNRVDKRFCTGDSLVKPLGIELCGNVQFTNAFKKDDAPWFPLTGPFAAQLTLNKRDTFTGYKFEARYSSEKKPKTTHVAHLSFNTPGSRYDRLVSAEATWKPLEDSINFDLRTPWKKMSLNGALINKADLKKALLRLTVDETKQYSIMGEVQIANKKVTTMYTPRIEVNVPGYDTYSMAGTLLHQKNKKLDLDVSFVNLFKEDASLKASVEKFGSAKNAKYKTELEIECQLITAKVQGTVTAHSTAGKSWASVTNVFYTLPRRQRERLTLHNKLKDLGSGALTKIDLQSSLISTQYPDFNFEIEAGVSKNKKTVQTSIEFGYGSDYQMKPKRLRVAFSGNNNSDQTKKHFDGKLEVQCTKRKIDYSLEFEHQHSPSAFLNKVTVSTGKTPSYYIIDLKKESTKPLKISADMSLKYPGREMKYSQKIHEDVPQQYKHELTIQLQQDQIYTVTSTIINGRRKEIRGEINAPGMKPIYLSGTGIYQQNNYGLKAETTYNGKTYSAESKWEMRPWSLARLTLDAAMPSRLIQGQIEMSKAGKKYATKVVGLWKQGTDQKRIYLGGDVTLEKTSPSFHAKAEWFPNHKVELTSEIKIKENGFWSSSREWIGKAQVESSFRDYESFGVALTHTHQGKDVLAHMDINWGPKKKKVPTATLR